CVCVCVCVCVYLRQERWYVIAWTLSVLMSAAATQLNHMDTAVHPVRVSTAHTHTHTDTHTHTHTHTHANIRGHTHALKHTQSHRFSVFTVCVWAFVCVSW